VKIFIERVEFLSSVKEIDRFVDGDLVKPAEESEFRVERAEFLERFDKH
jgi:hypothetical protein